MQSIHPKRKVTLFRNGRNQAVFIPEGYELAGTEAVICRVGKGLIVESVTKPVLLELLATLEPMGEALQEIDDLLLDDIEL